MELKRDEIVKALECCSKDKCIECHYHKQENECVDLLARQALTLINELTEENERLRNIVVKWNEYTAEANKKLDEIYIGAKILVEENKRLEKKSLAIDELLTVGRNIAIADTVSEMQKRLTFEFDRMHKNNFMTPEVRQWIINQIAKEMLEANDGK